LKLLSNEIKLKCVGIPPLISSGLGLAILFQHLSQHYSRIMPALATRFWQLGSILKRTIKLTYS